MASAVGRGRFGLAGRSLGHPNREEPADLSSLEYEDLRFGLKGTLHSSIPTSQHADTAQAGSSGDLSKAPDEIRQVLRQSGRVEVRV